MAAATFVGIASKNVFDAFNDAKFAEAWPVLSFRSLAPYCVRTFGIAVFACPLVMLPLYKILREANDMILVMLVSYQNGFFFQSIAGFNQRRSKK